MPKPVAALRSQGSITDTAIRSKAINTTAQINTVFGSRRMMRKPSNADSDAENAMAASPIPGRNHSLWPTKRQPPGAWAQAGTFPNSRYATAAGAKATPQ